MKCRSRVAGLLVAGGLVTMSVLGSVPVARAQSAPTLRWNPSWTRFTATQYALTGAMGGTLAFGSGLYEGSDDPRWRGPVLFDASARSWLDAGSSQARATASEISDYLLYGLMAYPFIDSIVVAGTVRASPDVALQMTMINLQATFLTKLISGIAKNQVGRERPDVARCQEGEEISCKAQARSFFSGHTSSAFTAAGLTCAHHQNLRLYGSEAAAVSACAAASGAAAAVGALRLIADRHYVSDVVMGAGVGFLSGFVLPNLINYDFGRSASLMSSVAPVVSPNSLGLQFSRTW